MKKQLLFAAFALLLTVTSCSKKEPIDPTPTPTNGMTEVKGDISASTKWTADKIYFLKGTVYVTSGATLTIEPGTIIKGDKATKGALVISRGGKIMAEGTADKPIVFTSAQVAGARREGDWGGLILLGKAPVNQGTDVSIEGIADDGSGKGKYGGTDVNDNSGVLKYVRVEFAGIPLSPDNEINGITFGGVGAGTTIDYVQVYRSGDDSFEWFGGTVNAKHLLAIDGWDDDFDTDFGYSGKIQFAVSQRLIVTADQSGSNGFESDNDGSGSNLTPKTSPIFSNITIIGPITAAGDKGKQNANFQHAAQIRRNSSLSAFNSVFAGFAEGIYIDDSKVATAGATSTNYTTGSLKFKNNIIISSNSKGNEVKGENKALFEATLRTDNVFNDALYAADLFNGPNLFSKDLSIKVGRPDFTLKTGSIAATGALFSDAKFTGDTFFDKTVTYKGAFGTTDWTAGWAHFDPQALDYTTPGSVK
ncbi:MAG: hypothetical protein V4541_09790 [Bacteroidota bacterium]